MAKAVLVTGGARRIGREICLALAHKGYDVALHYHSSQEEATATAQEVRGVGVRCELVPWNLEDTNSLERMLQTALEKMGSLSALVNNASIFERAGFGQTDPALLSRQFDVNFKAPLFLTQAFAKYCQTGQIVNILDTVVTRNLLPYFAYCLSKKALWDFTKMAASALAPGIRVNAVCPGLILPAEGDTMEHFQAMAARVPLRRPGSTAAVATAVCYLLESDYITGQTIFVDGGEHLG